ncbi:3-deoxy-D-manno-octulosonate 8-phosphate phosphatase KdsC [Rubripirellula lacrimiformis]|uniref:3-deoxy-D-manno-octulosonate 8-phosphate phosphatase KdsC n=1 Tax=Rubripirellula lacrimiformis TaxID=1930273 RepID=A0A517NCR8_9BACT|nr:HAD hydrolase family protein [Rubripirellula lacrimiformis]QDT04923.1 3-deoxy-D-manno-octulosonate 8-phosphate phosphatase KdsC [Rubripirellula lacrimiformis]
MNSNQRSDADHAANIRCILSDVDGVMTDGRIIYDAAGLETKRFHVRDGLGIKLWMQSGFAFGILTARTSPMVDRRAKELGITAVKQGYEDKWPAAIEMMASLGCTADQVCYIGDDLPDVPVMQQVGLSVAPADAARDVRETADWNLQGLGGEGVLRELIERLLRAGGRWEEHVRRTA